MSNIPTGLAIVLVGIALVDMMPTAARYLREIRSAREHIDRLAAQTVRDAAARQGENMETHAVGSNRVVEATVPRQSLARKVLLACGIASSVVYAAANILGAMRWQGYSIVSQTVSELSAIDAPSRPVVVPLMLAYSVLTIAFGLGVRQSAGRNRALRVVGGLLTGYGAVCLTGPFTPMHLRGVEKTLTDTLHVLITIVDVVFILLIIGFGAAAFGKRFRLYSIGTILTLLGFGAAAGMDGPRVAANLPTPWAGVTERINIGVFLLWAVALAIALLGAQSAGLRVERTRSAPGLPAVFHFSGRKA